MFSRALVLLAVIGSAAAFTVQPIGRSATQLANDNKGMAAELHDDPQLKDATRATILECDDQECAQMQCVSDGKGNWECEGGLEGEDRQTKKTVLMASMDDGE